MGWASVENGELLALASQKFDVFITVDRNLSFQQNLSGLPIAVVVLRAPTNRLSDLKAARPEAVGNHPLGPVRSGDDRRGCMIT